MADLKSCHNCGDFSEDCDCGRKTAPTSKPEEHVPVCQFHKWFLHHSDYTPNRLNFYFCFNCGARCARNGD